MASADIGLVGLAVMGENLALNMERNGFTVAVFNRTVSKVDEFVGRRGAGKKFIPTHHIEDLVASLKKPRKIFLMVKAGSAIDDFIELIKPHLERGDILIDGGNSHYPDTNRRVEELEKSGILFVGAGVSGGEEGALNGPSIMPGGSIQAWSEIKPIFQKIAAKVDNNVPCCDWVGPYGAGHFVKMVHNGIEYGDMQLICESYHLLKSIGGLSNSELSETFSSWNSSDLDSFLIEITAEIFKKRDEVTGQYLIDVILDAAGQKGTGKWTASVGLDLAVPVTLIAEAVYARCVSAKLEERKIASKIIPHPVLTGGAAVLDKAKFIRDVERALYCSKVVSYAQGFALMQEAGNQFKWQLNYGGVALMWRGGCIIRSKFLGRIKEAYDRNPALVNLLLDPFFAEVINVGQQSWRDVISSAVLNAIPTPAMSAALNYLDGYRLERLPANLLQAQRDFFGAHTYERTDRPRGEYFHTNWTGRGGDTSSTTYSA